MKEQATANGIKAAVTLFLAAFASYFASIAAPLIVLFIVVICDYITGITKAYVTRTLSSKTGFVGILKKLSYFLVVVVGMVADYLISSGLHQINADVGNISIVSLIVIIWLVINELLSILENLSDIGVPLPKFLKKIIERLLIVVEKKAEQMTSEKDGETPAETEEPSEADEIEALIAEDQETEEDAEENDEDDLAARTPSVEDEVELDEVVIEDNQTNDGE